MLDTASKGNFETRTPEEAKRLIENLVSSNSAKNLDMHRINSTVKDDNKIFEAEIGSIHEVSLVEQAICQDEDQRDIEEMKFMLEKLWKEQQEMTKDLNLHLASLCEEVNGRLETLDTHVKMLYTQASQTEEAVKKQEAFFQKKSTVHRNTVHLGNIHLTSIDTVHRTSIDTVHPTLINNVHPASIDTIYAVTVHHYTVHRDTVHQVIVHLVSKNTVDQATDGHQRDSILDNEFGKILEEEKREEDVFLVESSMSMGSSYWCRPTPTSKHRSTSSPERRPTPIDTTFWIGQDCPNSEPLRLCRSTPTSSHPSSHPTK